jgi:hypothetical protein
MTSVRFSADPLIEVDLLRGELCNVRQGSEPSSWSAKCRERTLRFALPQEIRCSALIYSLFRLAGNSTANRLQRAIGTLSAKFPVFSGISGNWGRRDSFAEASQHSHLIAVSRSLQTPCSKCPEEARNCAIKWPWLSGGRFANRQAPPHVKILLFLARLMLGL